MQLANSRTGILWRQVWGVAALLAAILFSFMTYGLYQPKILTDLGFVELVSWLGTLGMVPAMHAGLGTGLYFGGMGAASALGSILMKSPGGMTPTVAVFWAAIAFLVAAPCLKICQRLPPL